VTGTTLTFNADMTFSWNLHITESGTVSLPAACLSPGGGPCSGLSGRLISNPSVEASQTCTSAASGGCTCDVSVREAESLEGTYSTAGTEVTLTPTTGQPVETGYCVQGTVLFTWYLVPRVGGLVGSTVIASYDAFAKQ
jgi:hypothetical protein